jgi:hypothetical protein
VNLCWRPAVAVSASVSATQANEDGSGARADGEPDLTRPTGGRSDEMTLLPGHAALVAFHLAAGG